MHPQPPSGPRRTTAVRTRAGDAWLKAELRRQFGHEEFRFRQGDVVREVISGHDTLAVMPTGSGKSLCYQLPSVLRPGLTLVVSPLVALMRDQVESLADNRHVRAGFINSSIPGSARRARLADARRGRYDLLYVSPERLAMGEFVDVVRQAHVWLVVVDEAHCISEWGHDFRPAYLRVNEFVKRIGRPTILATTATATQRVRRDITDALDLAAPAEIVTEFDRPNLTYEVWPAEDLQAKLAFVQHLAETTQGSAIIYVGTRREAEEVARFCREELGIRVRPYHAGMDKDDRDEVQGEFISGSIRAVAATCAFGMGIHKPDVRLVLHLSHPGSIEAYYQEAGRAGRDGDPARCVTLYSAQDRKLHEYMIRHGAPTAGQLGVLFDALVDGLDATEGWVDTEALQTTTHLPRTALRVGIVELAQRGALDLLDTRDRRIQVKLLQDRLPKELLDDHAQAASRRAKHKQDNLARVVAYCEATSCRRAKILKHFGQTGITPRDACCDLCMGASPPAIAPARRPVGNGPVRISADGSDGWALGYYRTRDYSNQRSEVGELVRAFKYRGKREAGRELALRALRLIRSEDFPAVDLCVPVPRTGSDKPHGASVVLAGIIAGLGGPPMDAGLLRKTRRTRFQKAMTTLPEKERNVRRAFEAPAPEALRGKRVLLLDDLFDSGATMAECARVLRRAGAARVSLLAAARLTSSWPGD